MRFRIAAIVLFVLLLAPTARAKDPLAGLKAALGEKGWEEFRAASGIVAKVEVLVRYETRLTKAALDRDAGLALANHLQMEAQWREK